MKIIAISGFIGSGKDTVAEYLIKNYGFKRESLANSLKDSVSAIFNWPRKLLEGDTIESRNWREQPDKWWSEKLGIENFTPRLAMQLIGTEVFRNNFNDNIWIYSLEARLKHHNRNIVITDCRFPNEIELIKKLNGSVIWVKRDLPEWYEMALIANKHLDTELYFKQQYKVHDSEFKWVGTEFDYILDNKSDIETLNSKIDLMMTLI